MLDQTTENDGRTHSEPTLDPLLKPGRNVWRVARADRAAVLIDGAAYFDAVRKAMLRAERTIHIVGWDLDSRMRLVGPSGACDDGLPETLSAFLAALVERRPKLRIRLLLWDYSLVFALQRELMPIYSFLWATPPQIEICLDDVVPVGASHHQKLVVIDDAMAFSGGLDLTGSRWDTCEHIPCNPVRTQPGGAEYPPFHDVQMAVDGSAAVALGELVRKRWDRAACETLRRPGRYRSDHDVWPSELKPDFREVDVGIARTMPRLGAQRQIGEVAALFEDMIARADRLLYVENQFVTHAASAERLAARMRERPELETVIVAPRDYHGWVERRVMLAGRLRFMRILEEAGCGGRLRLLYPEARAGTDRAAIMVHSKVMIVDDEVLRVGSANLCNRSMGLDTECDLVVVAGDDATRRAVADVRNRLLAEHCGLPPTALEQAMAEGRSICAMLDGTSSQARRLLPVEDKSADIDMGDAMLDALADPIEPLDEYPDASPQRLPRSRIGLVLKVGLGIAALALLTLVWQMSPAADIGRIERSIASIADRPWAPFAVIAIFLLAECVAFPVTLLIFATIAVFGGWSGALLAGVGAMASAVATYLVGRYLGSRFLRRFIGPRINRVRRSLSDRGVLAVACVRLVPVAPFTVVNLVAGAAGLRAFDYVAGTAIGLLPGLVVMSALGNQISALFSQPTFGGMVALVGVVLLWLLVGFGLQFLVARYRHRA